MAYVQIIERSFNGNFRNNEHPALRVLSIDTLDKLSCSVLGLSGLGDVSGEGKEHLWPFLSLERRKR